MTAQLREVIFFSRLVEIVFFFIANEANPHITEAFVEK